VGEPTPQEYLSPEWIAAAREVCELLFRQTAGIEGWITASQEVTDPPEHLRRAGQSTIGWAVTIGADGVEVVDLPRPEAHVYLRADYETLHRLQTFAVGEDPGRLAELAAIRAEATAAGRLSATVDLSNVPAVLIGVSSDLHDRLVAITR
jgi:hypothetical protein